MSTSFEQLLSHLSECEMKKVAVAVAQDGPVLEAVKIAKDRGIAEPILVGDKKKIEEIAAELSIDLTGVEIVDVEDEQEATLSAVSLVHDHKADMYTK